MIGNFDINKIVNEELALAYITGKQDVYVEIQEILKHNTTSNGYDVLNVLDELIELISI